MEYSKKTLKYFKNLKYMGEIKNPDATGEVGNPVCGDILKIFLKIGKNKKGEEIIKDIKVLTTGCIGAISSASVVCELAKGKTLEKAEKITKDVVVKELDGLPEHKVHCSLLAVEALKKAIENYKIKGSCKRK